MSIVLLVNLLPLLAGARGEFPLDKIWRHSLTSEPSQISLKLSRTADEHGRFRRDSKQDSKVDVQQQFCSSISALTDELYLDQPVLLHTTAEGNDTLIDDDGHERRNISIESEIYRNFMVLSHLPVTAITILLPELLANNFTLGVPMNSSARLKTFQRSLEKLKDDVTHWFGNITQREVGCKIVEMVSAFITDVLKNKANQDTQRFIKKFTADLQPQLSKAAEFALTDYFAILNKKTRSDIRVVIAAEGFAYPGSFLFQYYESKLNGSERIAVVDLSSCNAAINITDFNTLQSILSNTTFLNATNMLFSNSGPFPLHSILSEAARKLLLPTPTFKGFQTRIERLYVILIVALFSATIVCSVMICSVYCEDKLIKMENKPVKPKRLKPPKGPSLLTPFAEKEIASSYSAFHQLRKKHMRRKGDSDETELLSPDHEADKHKARYARLSTDSDNLLPSSSTVDETGHNAQTPRPSEIRL